MPSRNARIESWHGDELADRILDASKSAVDAATTAAVGIAEATVAHRGGRLGRHINSRPAVEVRGQVVGFWGVLDDEQMGFYAWMVENGGSRSPAQPFLRPAADVVQARLSADIRRRFT